MGFQDGKVNIPTKKEIASFLTGNRYDLMEWAGAFGDLGTLIPFVLAYITILKMDPAGLLLAFGMAKIVNGLYYKTPVPIQPMKAIGIGSVAQAGGFTPVAVSLIMTFALLGNRKFPVMFLLLAFWA
ncbi:putative sulfate/molybdate transporter [Neomoorella thermoacetica]|uniref:putative sulfate/molybdate transporter n=1 Tax=Neomoorella thermoacetica TaxID=1525 RepID=UPI0008FA1B07|nr:putative sulfate/molybdate transporter [Moorella thermoacetica]OIQ12645.1 hypothetical protein MOOTH_00260 [Moorella thermoacetica]